MFGRGINVGRVFGVKIQLDPSVLLIFLIVLFNLGAGVFPHWHPDWSPGLSWVVAASAAVLFLCSVLVHELAHAFVARRHGLRVRSIRLFLFGGAADIEHEPESPRAEALIAGIGPVVSIGLGFVFGLLASTLTPLEAADDPMIAIQRMGPIATLLSWLAPVNFLLGVFNLIPGFPLDGGRLLRALLWALTKNLRTATRWAARLGQAFGWLLILTGISLIFGARVPLLGGGLIQGIWLALIGWFLNGAAAMSYRQVVVRALLEDVPVSRLMRKKLPEAVRANAPVARLVDDYVMRTGEPSYIVVDEASTPVGIVRSGDIRRVARDAWDTTPIRELAADLRTLPTISPREDALGALEKLDQTRADELVVLENGQLLGMIRRTDIARWLELQAEDAAGEGPWRRHVSGSA